jgi:NAD-dependent deacetylase
MYSEIKKAATFIKSTCRGVSLTGAGYSTPSGIPDFRSSQSGLWQQYDPMEVASLSAFRFQPKRFYSWFRPLALQIFESFPNLAHFSLAKLEEAGHFVAVITQNIDGLHQSAGSKRVYEIHGSIKRAACSHCYKIYKSEDFIEPYLRSGKIPKCPNCSHILKPDVVLVEEQLPYQTWQMAESITSDCDLMLVAGSSLQVIPAAQLPVHAIRNGAYLLVINKSPTYIDHHADVVIQGDVAEVMPMIVNEVLGG